MAPHGQFPPHDPQAQFGSHVPYGPPAVVPPAGPKSKRGLWILLGSVLAVVLLITGTLFGLRSYFQGQQAERAAAYAAREDERNPIKRAEIDALLAGLTKALKDRDEKAFLAAYDPAQKKLVSQQTTLFRNLVKVPFAEATFMRYGGGSDFKPLGTGASVEQPVAFVHKLDGYDLHPVSEEYRWTIVRTEKGAPIKVTAAKGITSDDSFVSYYPAPWDKWRNIHVERTKHTLFIVDASLKAQARRYAPEAERAAVANLAAWRAGGVSGAIPQGFVISLVKGRKDLGSLYRESKEVPPEAGFSLALSTFEDPNALVDDDTNPQVGGSRVVVDLGSPFFRPSEPDGPGLLFRHELGHSLAAALTFQKPSEFASRSSWLIEGFAEYLAYERRPWTVSGRTPAVKQSLRDGYALRLQDDFDLSNPESSNLDYWAGHSAVGYMAEKYGEQKTFEVVAEHYRGKEVGDALQQVLGVSDKDFNEAWKSYVLAKIR
ncbi:hypothetical protein AB0J82_07800 [Asanoa sp. NPDC049518]|uniref:hypothetical protein n=1 Tax=unclassified Asanoa TaxID=2685164 RepID=UPI00342D098A